VNARHWWAGEWTGEPRPFVGGGMANVLHSFTRRADRDAWVATAASIPPRQAGSRRALTAAHVRAWVVDAERDATVKHEATP